MTEEIERPITSDEAVDRAAHGSGTGRTVHMCVSIEGVLRWPDKDLVNMFSDDNGHRQPARMVRDFLKLELLKGRRVLPMGEPCEGWSYETGCPGHPAAKSPNS